MTEVAQLVQARPVTPASDARKTLETHRARIEQWLSGEKPLRLVRVHELLARDGVDVGYTTLRRFVHAELGWRERAVTVRIDDPPPGEEAQVDFGLMGYVVVDGVRRRLWAFIVTLTCSRHQFVWPTFTQTVEDVCAGLDAAWTFFGGTVRRLVLDNATSMVVRADAQTPTLQRSFAEYVQLRGIFADPARVRHPRDKARVENQVPFVREPVRTDAYTKFLNADVPRAFAVSPTGAWAWRSGTDAVEVALSRCQIQARTTCRLYAVDDRVVWRIDQR